MNEAETRAELDEAKLPVLLELKYHELNDAVAELGKIALIRDLFVGFQKYLYSRPNAMKTLDQGK
jgi:type I restriction enzyme R subunit